MAEYVELHCHSNYSFHDGASAIHELTHRAKELGYAALALTDHDNLCGAMEFAQAAQSLDLNGIIGAEVTLEGGHHLTLLAETQKGYNNLCRLISYAHINNPRRNPAIALDSLPDHAEGLIALSGCPLGEVPRLVQSDSISGAEMAAKRYLDWFGPGHFYLELQRNLVYGDDERIRGLMALSRDLGIGVLATNDVHYHRRYRHRLQDALVAIRACKTLDETHRERRPNSEFYMKPPAVMASLFAEIPEAITNTLVVAERCKFDLARDLDYRFPDYPVPDGYTPDTYLAKICCEAARRKYGFIDEKVSARLEEELRLIGKHGLAGFLLIYYDIIQLAREIMIELGLSSPDVPLEDNPPGRGRGSSVAMLVGYLIGLSHIDPLKYNLSLERFLSEGDLGVVPDIDLDFPRNIREKLIVRVHQKWGWDHAALAGMIGTYRIKGAIRDLGKAFGLPEDEVDRLAKRVDHSSAKDLRVQMHALPDFRTKADSPSWQKLIELAAELDGFPKYLAQHPGGMIISSSPLIDLVPVQRGAIEGRYICQWDKSGVEDAGFVKIDFLALGTLSQMQEALLLIEERYGQIIDLSRVDFDDQGVYDTICEADTIGVFQVESAAQMQTVVRLRPRNLVDMAREVGAVRPGVGVNDGVTKFIARHMGKEPVTFEHPLERRALERTLGVILFQDQVNQIAIDVAGFAPTKADQLRRVFGRKNNEELLASFWRDFRDGAAGRGVDEATARRIFRKFNGFYMFPESHAFAFGVTAYQAAWLKYYYPLEFYLGLFNQQPMGFYNLETLKEDARRHDVRVLNPDINLSMEKCIADGMSIRMGLLNVTGVGSSAATSIVKERAGRHYDSLADFANRTVVVRPLVENLVDAGVFDSLVSDRRSALQEVGLRYHSRREQPALDLPVEQDLLDLHRQTEWDRMEGEYRTMGLYPSGHAMAHMRWHLGEHVMPSNIMHKFPDGAEVTTAGLVIRRQHPMTDAVFVTLEDEFGHIPLIVWPGVYNRYRDQLREPFVLVSGRVTRRDGTFNIIVTEINAVRGSQHPPESKNWR